MGKLDSEDRSDSLPYAELIDDEAEPDIRAQYVVPCVTVEPMVFVNVLGLGAMYVTYQSFMIKSICLNHIDHFNNTNVDCDNLQAFKAEEAAVEQEAVHYLAYRKMLETSIVIFYALFLGDWIKRNGSKSMMVLPLIGWMVSAFYMVVLTAFPGIHPAFIVLAALPVGVTGGNLAAILSVNTYVTNITTPKNRTFRFSMAEASAVLGFPVGLWTGAALGKATGFTGVFVCCASLQFAALFYTILFIQNDGPEKWLTTSMFQNLFHANAAKDIIQLCQKARAGSKRLWLFLTYMTLSLRLFTFGGLDTVVYLYTRHVFKWSSVEFSNFTTCDSFLVVVGILFISLVGMKILKLQDAIIGVVGTVGTIFSPMVFALATEGWMLYLALGFQMFAGVIYIVYRAITTKIVAPGEVATAFVLSGILEAAIPVTSAPFYGMIYSLTLNSFPATVFLLSAAGNLVTCAIFLYLAIKIPKPIETSESMIDHSVVMSHLEE